MKLLFYIYTWVKLFLKLESILLIIESHQMDMVQYFQTHFFA